MTLRQFHVVLVLFEASTCCVCSSGGYPGLVLAGGKGVEYPVLVLPGERGWYPCAGPDKGTLFFPLARTRTWVPPPAPQERTWDQILGYPFPHPLVNKQIENITLPRTSYAGCKNESYLWICDIYNNFI